jgi:geranylgeranyl reductase family protein
MERAYDALIIGGGPAGALTAYHLARRGVDVAILEAKSFPRPKACGGGLQARTVKLIPFNVAPVLRGAIHRVNLTYALGSQHSRVSSAPLIHTVLRSEFDEFLLRHAAAAGAIVRQGVTCRDIAADPAGGVRVETSEGRFRARCLVGADGANSVVRLRLNSRSDYFWQAGVYCEIPEEWLNGDALAADAILIDWGAMPSGYAWAFPKRGFVNVGAGGPLALVKHLREYALRFVQSSRLVKRDALHLLKFAGHHLPTLTRRTRLATREMLLVGDAAGCVEPFTGDGICFACKSAEIAARCIAEAIASGVIDLRQYSRRIRRELGQELHGARKLLSLSTVFPSLPFRLFRDNDRVWDSFCRLLYGEGTFLRFHKDVLGPFGFAMRAVDFFSTCLERHALRRAFALPPLSPPVPGI